MAPLSVLPGRIRFESQAIIGQFKVAEYLEREITGLDGVFEASVNYRTGRILVKFNESMADRMTLSQSIKYLSENMPVECSRSGLHDIQKASASGFIKHVLIDALAHALLPKPLGVLLPLAINTIRRKEVRLYD